MAGRRWPLVGLFSIACATTWAQVPVGAEFQVNSNTALSQSRASVASDGAGNFVVVWHTLYVGVFGRRFSAAGVPLGGEFQVNTSEPGYHWYPGVAAAASGSFVVVWENYNEYTGRSDVLGRRYDDAGLPLGGLQISADAPARPAVASDAGGNFIVVWGGQDGSDMGVFGRRYDAAGVPQGARFMVNSYATFRQGSPAVAVDASGNFVVVWDSSGQDGSGSGIFGQRFNAAGLPEGLEFQVNSHTPGNQNAPAVSFVSGGSFVVAWDSYGQDGGGYSVFGQLFDAVGARQGGEFPVNTYTTATQCRAAVSPIANGSFVVVWDGSGNGDSWGIFGQRFIVDLIFRDGFE